MPRPRLCTPLRILILATMLSASTIAAMPANPLLFKRQDACPANNPVSCPSALPGNICCAEGTVCKALAGGTTVVCCPEGKTCNKIQPITCNVKEQDPKDHPDAPIKTTVFNVDLEKCGSNTCCPFGYSCQGDNECVKNDDQSQPPKGAAGSTTTTTAAPSSTATGTETGVPSSTSVPGKGVDSNQDSDNKNNNNNKSSPSTTSIVGGVVGGCVILLLIAAVIFLFLRRRNKRYGSGPQSEKPARSSGPGSHKPRPTSSNGSFGNIISDPIMQPNSYRADFILKGTPSAVSQASVPRRNVSTHAATTTTTTTTTTSTTKVAPQLPRIRLSIPNPFNSPNPSPIGPPSAQPSPGEDDRPPRTGTVAAARLPPIRGMKTQQSHWSRQPVNSEYPSSESINVFADSLTVEGRKKDLGRRLTHGTTFTELMDEAELGDVRRGRPYVPGTTPRI